MLRYLFTFTAVTLLPAGLLFYGSTQGGWWAVAPLLLLGFANHIVDALFDTPAKASSEAFVKDLLPMALALIHFTLLITCIWALVFQPFAPLTKIALFFGYVLFFSHVSNAVGHELIHRTRRLPFNLGKWVFISVLFGHHTSAHRLVHHPYVATRYDPNSARFGENFYRFFVRAWRGSFLAGLGAENQRLGYPANSRAVDLTNPYFTYIVGAFLCMGLAAAFAGWKGLLLYLTVAFFTQAGLLMTDYVQHYGLTRPEGEDGTFPAVSPHHSWNAPHLFTRKLTLNAPLHSDHHVKPARPFTELQMHTASTAPQLPYSPGIMSVLALYPPRWRKVMNPRVAQWAMQNR